MGRAADALDVTVEVEALEAVNDTAPPAFKDRAVVAAALSLTTATPMPIPTAVSPAAFAPAATASVGVIVLA